MSHQLTLVRPYRYIRGAAGVVDMPVGTYAVPADLPLAAARSAVEQGLGILLEAPAAPMQGRSKGVSPENKMLGLAPENKFAPQSVPRRWARGLCIVAATGPSLTQEVAEACRGKRVIAVNDAYRILPFADALYACDAKWWDVHNGCPEFAGEKWSSHGTEKRSGKPPHNDKLDTAQRYGINLVRGVAEDGFSLDPSVIHYGSNSGFQAINLAMLFGATRILLVGFDMRVNGQRHFFGDHPQGLNNTSDFSKFIPDFKRAARLLPSHIEIINCTPGSAIQCFPTADLNDALSVAA